MSYAYQNLLAPKNTRSGVAENILLAPVDWFTRDGIKCPAAPFSLPGDEITIKESHVFKTGKGFLNFQLAPQKNSLSYTTVGDLSLSRQNAELKIFIAGSYKEAHESIKNLINTPLIALIKDASCEENMYYQLGCDCTKAWLTASFTTGTTKDGVKGYEATLTYDGGPQFYEGLVDEFEADDSSSS